MAEILVSFPAKFPMLRFMISHSPISKTARLEKWGGGRESRPKYSSDIKSFRLPLSKDGTRFHASNIHPMFCSMPS